MSRRRIARGVGALGAMLVVARAGAPGVAHADIRDWLRSKNRQIERGNEKMAAGDAKAALAQYDKAARELPGEGGVHLDRGLALMQTGDRAGAREALRLATQPPASRDVRADAHYDLGLDLYREADALAAKGQHEEAQQLFRESADAFRQSLRLRPGNRDAAWNLELGARRIREQEEKKKEQEKKDGEDEKDEENKQDPQDENQDGQEPQQDQDQKQDKPGEGDPQKQDQKQQEPPKPDPAKQDAQKPPPKPETKPGEPQPKPESQAKPIPAEVSHALDALQDSEENLERLKARMRAQQERRAPEKDW